MHALDHRAVLRGHQAGCLRAGNAERVNGLRRREPQPPRRAGGGRIDADRRTRMPALADMLLPHAQSDPRTDLVAGHRGGQEFPSVQHGMTLRHCDQCGQRHRADMQHAPAVNVIELEALHLGAIDQRGMRRGEPHRRAPNRGCARRVHFFERTAQDATPCEMRAVNGTAERIEDQKLDALPHRLRDPLIGQRGNELGDFARMRVVRAAMLSHPGPRQ